MGDKLNIGVMFCGGCNSYYDRRKLYQSLCQELGKLAQFTPSSYLTNEQFDLVLIINGCPSVCLTTIDFNAPTLLINNCNYLDGVEIVRQFIRDKFEKE